MINKNCGRIEKREGLSKLEECAGWVDVEVYKGGVCNRWALLGQEWPSLGGLPLSETNFTPGVAKVSSRLGDSDNP